MNPEVVTGHAEFAAVASDAAPGARVPVALRLSVDDPFAAYRRARTGDGEGGAYLETTGGQPGWGYFGVDPVDRLSVGPSDGDALAALSDRLAADSLVRGDCPVPYPCGAIGWLSYDVARELEALPASAERDRDLPRLQLAVYDCLAAWEDSWGEEGERGDDGERGKGGERGKEGERDGEGEGNGSSADSTRLWLTACPRVDAPEDPAAVEAAYDAGLRRARWLADRIQSGDPEVGPAPVDAPAATFESDCSPAEFAGRVRTVKRHVREGETFQANVSQRLRAPAAVHPVAAFAALRQVNPAPYSALLEFPGVDLVSASPELLLAREGDRVATEPIAGTRPRGETPAEDEHLEDDLLTDEKERAEHAMLVDLERNDLGKVCTYGSVAVPEYRRVDRYSAVMHLVSLVEGRLRPEADLADAIRAIFPGGTITGAPKPRTMEIIDEVESTRRGPYTGSVGLFGFDERATLSIVIRTLVRYGAEYHLRVGAGIVHDSDPEREFDETMDKARALLSAVDAALDDRTAVDLSRSV